MFVACSGSTKTPDAGQRVNPCPTPVIRRVDAGSVSVLAIAAQLADPVGVAVEADGGLLAVADDTLHQIVIVNTLTGLTTVVADRNTGLPEAYPYGPFCVAFDDEGNLIAGSMCRLTEVVDAGSAITVAGTGTPYGVVCPDTDGSAGPSGTASVTMIRSIAPAGDAGVVYFADLDSVRLLSNGQVETLFFTGSAQALAFSAGGSLILWTGSLVESADATGVTATLAGQEQGYVDGEALGDGGAEFGGNVGFPNPQLAAGQDGTLYLADPANNAVRVLTPSGAVFTLLGDGPDCALDGGAGALSHPQSVAVDAQGIVYIADTGNARILVVRP